jgi:hypothetical protein
MLLTARSDRNGQWQKMANGKSEFAVCSSFLGRLRHDYLQFKRRGFHRFSTAFVPTPGGIFRFAAHPIAFYSCFLKDSIRLSFGSDQNSLRNVSMVLYSNLDSRGYMKYLRSSFKRDAQGEESDRN